jgi:hypothetical protein
LIYPPKYETRHACLFYFKEKSAFPIAAFTFREFPHDIAMMIQRFDFSCGIVFGTTNTRWSSVVALTKSNPIQIFFSL